MSGAAALLPAAAIALASCAPAGNQPAAPIAAPPAIRIAAEPAGEQLAVFAGGCFWGTQAVFSRVPGVLTVRAGYHGGSRRAATYALVSGGLTEHVEAVEVRYDPTIVRYDELLRVFFSVAIDPTVRHRQGPDRGAQYDAQVVVSTPEQEAVAAAYRDQLARAGRWRDPIVTPLVPGRTFYPAEPEHQDFAARNPAHPYVQQWIAPKLAALERSGLVRPAPSSPT
ncbi:peptide-methionine (S)-S-oxide reductase MsrA [Qipengyuania thermophila]|uniref:peptide-methionine (S)-S-oxide reductase MsrA n=1 Tax=Qipengyuania thermophila TaxID=2509361 RepID=UPI001F235DA8|nr:peptide-methionine (S)-S-oxide reductase MsrA [Qipengyuania thermophila]